MTKHAVLAGQLNRRNRLIRATRPGWPNDRSCCNRAFDQPPLVRPLRLQNRTPRSMSSIHGEHDHLCVG